jgi:hypothetical protein
VQPLRKRTSSHDLTAAQLCASRKSESNAGSSGALAGRVARVDETHLVLILEFAGPEDADRIAREVGGPWMREHIRPLLAGGTERGVSEVRLG